MTYIPDHIRRAVMERARRQCEYCQTQQSVVIMMEIDHIIPVSADGLTTLDNLAYTCPTCNGAKLYFLTGIDPETNQEVTLFNPRQDRWIDHFRWSDDSTQMIGITSMGRATIQRLNMNDQQVCDARRRWVSVGWHPPQQVD
jgi:hypothetical protein